MFAQRSKPKAYGRSLHAGSQKGWSMLDALDYFLITLRTGIVLEGKRYLRVWGMTSYEHVMGVDYIKVGGHGNELLIAPDEILFAHPCTDEPVDEEVLVRAGDYDSIIATFQRDLR